MPLFFSIIGLLILFIPFGYDSQSFYPYINGPAIYFKSMMVPLFLFPIFYKKPNIKISKITALLLIFCVWQMITAAFTPLEFRPSWYGSLERAEGLYTWFLLTGFSFFLDNTEKSFRRWAIITIAIVSISTIPAVLTTMKLKPDHIVSVFGNPTWMANYSLMAFILFLYLIIDVVENRPKYFKWMIGLSVTASICVLWFMIISRSRATMISLGVVFLILGFREITKARIKRLYENHRIPCFIAIGLALVGVITLLVLKGDSISFYLFNRWNNFWKNPRLGVWSSSLKMFLDHPILGVGHGKFGLNFNTYFPSQLFGTMEWFDRPHNFWIRFLAISGLPGFMLYLSIWLLPLYTVFKSNYNRTKKSLLFAFLFSQAIFLVFNFNTITDFILWILFLELTKTEDSYINLKFKWPIAGALTVLMITHLLGIRTIWANRMDFRNLLISNAHSKYRGSILPKKIQLFDKRKSDLWADYAIKLYVSPNIPYVMARNNPKEKNFFFNSAINSFKKYLKKYPKDVTILYLLGRLYIQYGRRADAAKVFRQTLKLSPTNTYMYVYLSETLLTINKGAEAFQVISRGLNLTHDHKIAEQIYAKVLLFTGKKELFRTSYNSKWWKNYLLMWFSNMGIIKSPHVRWAFLYAPSDAYQDPWFHSIAVHLARKFKVHHRAKQLIKSYGEPIFPDMFAAVQVN